MLKSKLRFLLIFFLFTFNGSGLCAQGSLSVDSSRLEIREHRTSLTELKTRKDYQYGFEITPPLNTWWAKFINSVVKAYDDFFNDVSKGSYRKFFFILVITLALAYLVLRFFGFDVSSPFQRKEKNIEMGYYSEKETIHGRDFKKEIEAAINIEDFKLAIRLYYLMTLKTLADKNLIAWQPNKTNRSYYHELKPAVQKDFGSLTDAFEYSWYGNFEVGKSDFDEIKMKFENFKI
jgi:hypothetical protein